METQEESINYLLYLNYISQWTTQVESKLNHAYNTLQQFTNIIITAREKKVRPALITNNQRQQIAT